MTVHSAADMISTLENCDKLTEFLEKDLKSRNEVGFCLGEDGTVFEFREGNHNQVDIVLPPRESDINERRIIVHTHPSFDATTSGGLTISNSDADAGEHPAVCGMIILSEEMFDVNWEGKAILFKDGEIGDRADFTIECEGTTDGPAEERWIENPNVRY